MLGDLAAVKDALTTTNALLEQVLAELKRTNDAQLETVAQELRAVHVSVDRLVEQQQPGAAAA